MNSIRTLGRPAFVWCSKTLARAGFAAALTTAVVGCTGNSDLHTTSTVTTNEGNGPAQNAEPLDVVKQMLQAQTVSANTFLDLADGLKFQDYVQGPVIAPDDCAAFEQIISRNYPLHSYSAWSPAKGDYQAAGVRLCPRDGSSEKVAYDSRSANVSLFIGTVHTTLGLTGDRVLTVTHLPSFASRFPLREQYVIDNTNRVIEMTSSVAISKNGEFFNVISAVTREGHVVARAYREVNDSKAPYIWRSASTFVAQDGTISSAMRVRQNDGQGREVTKFSLDVPYQIKWLAFEVSPMTRIRGIYQIAGTGGAEKTDWLKSKVMLELISRGAESCGSGHIGYNAKGGSIREFGDIQCSNKLDVNKTIN